MWKPIVINNIKTFYEISDEGKIRNVATQKILKQQFGNGYLHCTLSVNGKSKRCRVHRLVAEAFIENPENKPFVNHIDGKRTNNNAQNLEWTTPSENARHAVTQGLRQGGNNRPVIQYTMNGVRLLGFQSIVEAEKETGTLGSKIVLCCKRKRRSANNFQWRYADDKQDVVKIEKKWWSGKRVAQYTLDGELINTFSSYSEAARAINGQNSAICLCCAGERKSHKGFRWEVVEEIVQDD